MRRISMTVILAVASLFGSLSCVGASGQARPAPYRLNWTAVRADGDRRLVITFTGAAAITSPPRWCEEDYRAVVRDDGMQLAVSILRIPSPEQLPRHWMCTLEGHGRSVVAQLPVSWRGRTVINAGTGMPAFVIDTTILQAPRYLPDGFALSGESGFSDFWTRTWTARPSEECREAPRLSVGEGPSGFRMPMATWHWTVVGEPTVNGTTGKMIVNDDTGSLELRWDDGRRRHEVSSNALCIPSLKDRATELLEVANSLQS